MEALRDAMTTHAAEHERVSAAISSHILAFAAEHSRFHMSELTAYVAGLTPTAPDSAGRILRALRQEGKLAYRLVSRRDSEYEITAVKHEDPQQAPQTGDQRGTSAPVQTVPQEADAPVPAASSPNRQLVLV